MQSCLALSPSLVLAELPAWMGTAWAYILVILGFSVVVFVHELGHFAAAKWAGVRVQAFAVGFGRRLISFRKGLGVRLGSTDAEFRRRIDQRLIEKGIATDSQLNDPDGPAFERERIEAARELGLSETEYRFNVLPLGGYVQMLGQEDFVVDKSGELKVKADPDSFSSKPIGKRMVIVSAGVIMNLIFAAILFTVVAMIGMPKPPPVLGYVVENTPAGRAGLLPGDRILEINGEEITDFMDLSGRIALSDPDEVLVMKVERDGKIVTPPPQVRPEFVADRELRQIGVAPGETRRVGGLAFGDITTARADELHEKDLITHIVIDGKPVECRDAGIVRREMMRAEGRPVDLIVKRPRDPASMKPADLVEFDPDIPSDTVKVQVRAMWLPLPYDSADRSSASLLGLVPRLSVLAVDEGKSFAAAGVKAGDVLVRIGKYDYPTHSEVTNAIQNAPADGLELKVRRKGVKRDGLSEAAMDFCIAHREDAIRAGLENFSGARGALRSMAATAGLAEADIDAVVKAVSGAQSADAWRKWFEDVDTVTLSPLKPSRPFALFSNPPATLDAQLLNIDEDHLVIADVVGTFGTRETPAKSAGLERGAVILTVNGERVREWYQLSHALRENAGKTVQIEYRLVDRIVTTDFNIPNCVNAALGLSSDDRIVRIDDKTTCMVPITGASTDPSAPPRTLELALPDWRAIEQMLKNAAGRTVKVEYVTADGVRKTGEFAATVDTADPWLARVQFYARTFVCYPMFETESIANPFKAFVVGMKKAYDATMATVQTIRHMLFTKNVGLSNVSGPLGIAHKGSQVAEGGIISLFWFLGLISANLAVINFLPLPIVDGGLFLFLILEKVRGEPVSIKTQVATQLLGIALIATVFILVTYQDILRLVTGGA